GLGGLRDEVLGDAADDLRVDLEQVHAAHAGLAGQSRGDDDDVGVRGRLVAAALVVGGGPDALGLEALDGAGLVHVERQALGLALDDAGEDDLVEDVVLGETLRRGGAVETGAYDRDFLTQQIGLFIGTTVSRYDSGHGVLTRPLIAWFTPRGGAGRRLAQWTIVDKSY